MKNLIAPLFLLVLFASCISQKNSDAFIKSTEGRYLFNANEVIEIYFKEQTLFAKWRGNDDLKLLKVNDSTFYMKELNEKMLFVSKPEMHIELAPKTEHEGVKYYYKKLAKGEKTPFEYIENNEFNKALYAYKLIKEKDSLNEVVKEYRLNRIGYKYIKNKEFNKAIEIFKINTVLYPKSSNTFDSLGDAYLKYKDTVNAVISYKKALNINPENRSSKRMLKKITKK
ncbi:hypothetical protein [uncultured Polaribacter sp.]|uniref:tetratricopeptide repeat protein n=1 Tax=uncultured Polaribacter sp. TaxID=174711 RepID=UPI002631BEA3|nr:hypothetical protein [uncultured Polaribacter sp.]